MVLAVALTFGGIAQLLAGMWEFRKGNVFGATVFSAYGAFWLSFWAYLTFFAEGIPTEHHGVAAGWYLIAWALFTTLMLVAALRTTAVLATLFAVVAVVFVLLALRRLRFRFRVDHAWAESSAWWPPRWPSTCASPRSVPRRSAGRSCRTARCSAADPIATAGRLSPPGAGRPVCCHPIATARAAPPGRRPAAGSRPPACPAALRHNP